MALEESIGESLGVSLRESLSDFEFKECSLGAVRTKNLGSSSSFTGTALV